MIPIDFVVKFIPDKICPKLGKKQKKASDSGVLNLRRKRTATLSMGNMENIHKETAKNN